jgi:hypothetical protein
MKNFISTLFLFSIILIFTQNASAQTYKNGIGLRFGWGYGVTFKHFVNQKAALEGVLNYRSYGALDYKYNYVRLTGLYLIHNPIASAEGLQWYYGGGLMYQSWGGDFDKYTNGAKSSNLGIVGALGLDYKFKDVPISITADWLPTFILSGYGDGFGGEAGGLAVRYTF